MSDDRKLSELALDFARLNPSLLRDMMESHSIRFKDLEFSNGKYVKGCAEYKNYKQEKQKE
jgi:hypothetical protein